MAEEVRITLRLPAELHAAVVKLSERQRRTLNAQIVRMLEIANDLNLTQ